MIYHSIYQAFFVTQFLILYSGYHYSVLGITIIIMCSSLQGQVPRFSSQERGSQVNIAATPKAYLDP